MSTYAGIGYVDETDTFDDIYIRHDTMSTKGELVTHDNSTGLSQALPPGVDGRVLVARPANQFGMAWEAPSTVSITGAALGGASSNGSGLTFTPNPITGNGTIALAASGVAAGTYGSGTQVAQITADTTGRATTLTNVAISPITVNTTTPIAGGGSVAPGGSITLSHANTGLGNVTYNSVTFDPRGHPTSGTNLTRTVVNGSYITLTGNTGGFHASTGGTMTIICTALDSVGTNAWAAGTSSVAAALAVAVGDTAKAGPSSVVVGYNSGSVLSSSSVFVGASQTIITGSGNVIIGANAGQSMTTATQNVFVGNQAGNLAAAAQNSVGVGYIARCNGPRAIALGANTYASAANAIAIGEGVTDVGSNTCLIGETAAFIVKSAGFLQSAGWYFCKAGHSSGTQPVT